VGLGLLVVEVSRTHTDTLYTVGLLWRRGRPVAETCTWQPTTITTNRHPSPRCGSKLQSQQTNDGGTKP